MYFPGSLEKAKWLTWPLGFFPLSSKEEGRLKDRESRVKKDCKEEGEVLPPFFLGQRIEEQREGGRKASSSPVATAFTLRELERKWIKWLI